MQRESFSEASSVSSADEGIAEPHNEGKVSPNPYSSMGSPDDRINTIIAVDDDEDEDVQIPTSFQPAATQIHPQHIELQPADPRLQVTNVIDDHMLSDRELEQRYGTDLINGLSDDEVRRRLERDGPNTLASASRLVGWKILVYHIFSGFSALIWVAAILCFVIYVIEPEKTENLYLGIMLILVVFTTGLFAAYQDHLSLRTMSGFKKLMPQGALVIRDGGAKPVPAGTLVLGDIVCIRSGEKVPADMRLFRANDLKVDNSSLTGESEPQRRTAEMTDENPMETRNLCFYSTLCVEGEGRGVVIRCGNQTMIGSIAHLTLHTKPATTPLGREISRFVRFITALALLLGLLCFIIAILSGYEITVIVAFVLGIIVANVPEGLISAVTAVLTLTAKRMARRNVLIKQLHSAESLGSCSVICSDKTGTLTCNRMVATHAWVDQILSCTQTPGWGSDSMAASDLIRCAGLCNLATFDPDQESVELETRNCSGGNATDEALLKFWALSHPEEIQTYRHSMYPQLYVEPFNSATKYMLAVCDRAGDPEAAADSHQLLMLLKGAPDKLLDFCTHAMVENLMVPISDEWLLAYHRAYTEMGSLGLRVIACCQRSLPASLASEETELPSAIGACTKELTFLGLIGVMDPPRAGVAESVALCKSAGIKVVMVTGDHQLTACEIAKQVGIISPESNIAAWDESLPHDAPPSGAIVVNSATLAAMSEEDLQRVIHYPEIVFARTTPAQKLRIVEAFQARGEIVAVTGDGVNDSPALKRADVGVAMGIAGSDVAKEAADVILMDDNFSSIVVGIQEGRLIFDNLKKSIAFTLSSNVPKLMPFLAYIILQMPLFLPIMFVIAVDIGTDLLPGISFAYERAESDLMLRPPRNPERDRLVSAKLVSFAYLQLGVMQALGAFYAAVVIMADEGIHPDSLVGLEPEFSDRNVTMIIEGRTWSYDDRTAVLGKAQIGYFIGIVLTQIMDGLVCKTRRLSLWNQPWDNWLMLTGFAVAIGLAVLITYVEPIGSIFGAEPIPAQYWFISIPYCILILVYDEVRKFLIRRDPHGWMEKYTYY